MSQATIEREFEQRRSATWMEWSRWFERATETPEIGAPEMALMAHIAGWADSTGGGWSLDADVLSSTAKCSRIPLEAIVQAKWRLERLEFIELEPVEGREGLSAGWVVFHAYRSPELRNSKLVRGAHA